MKRPILTRFTRGKREDGLRSNQELITWWINFFQLQKNQMQRKWDLCVVYQFISIFKINLITICHKFVKSAISQDLDLSDSLWKLNQVYSSPLKRPILSLAIPSFCILSISISILYFKMNKLIFNCKLLLKLRGPTLCLSIGTYAQQPREQTFIRLRGCPRKNG